MRFYPLPGPPPCKGEGIAASQFVCLPGPDETTDKTTQFWLRAKAQAIIDSHSTKLTNNVSHAARAFPRNNGALLLFLNESRWLSPMQGGGNCGITVRMPPCPSLIQGGNYGLIIRMLAPDPYKASG